MHRSLIHSKDLDYEGREWAPLPLRFAPSKKPAYTYEHFPTSQLAFSTWRSHCALWCIYHCALPPPFPSWPLSESTQPTHDRSSIELWSGIAATTRHSVLFLVVIVGTVTPHPRSDSKTSLAVRLQPRPDCARSRYAPFIRRHSCFTKKRALPRLHRVVEDWSWCHWEEPCQSVPSFSGGQIGTRNAEQAKSLSRE